jgi:hypothetical protein
LKIEKVCKSTRSYQLPRSHAHVQQYGRIIYGSLSLLNVSAVRIGRPRLAEALKSRRRRDYNYCVRSFSVQVAGCGRIDMNNPHITSHIKSLHSFDALQSSSNSQTVLSSSTRPRCASPPLCPSLSSAALSQVRFNLLGAKVYFTDMIYFSRTYCPRPPRLLGRGGPLQHGTQGSARPR